MSDRDTFDYPPESNLPIALWIVPLVAVVLTPGLVWSIAEKPFAMRFEMILAVTIGVAVVAGILVAILSRGFTQRMRWSLSVTAVTILALFQWPLLTFAGDVIAKAVRLPLLTNAAPVLIATALLWLATRNGGEWQFAAIVGGGTLIVVGALVISVLPVVETPATRDRGQAAPDAPDVLLLVLDGYVRADILQDDFDFDSGPFLHDLEELGFTVATEAQSNYGYTYASLASMLDLDYVFDLGTIREEDQAAMRFALSGNPVLMDLFRKAGYEIALTENAWEGSHCGPAVDICFRDGLVERAVWGMGQFTILAPVLETTRPHPFNSVSYEHLQSLSAHVLDDRTSGVPRMTISHIIMPHAPFLRDAECNYVITDARRSFAAANESQVAGFREMYADQVACVNQRIIEALQEIIVAKPDTIIMITGDHGSASGRIYAEGNEVWSQRGVMERLSILSAYRLPDCPHQTYASITPVNGARLVTDCALDTGLDTVPDRTLWAPPDAKGDVVSLEAKLASSVP